MKALIINKGTATFEDFEPTLEEYYKKIGCDVIDIVCYNVNGKDYDIICDDEGLLKSPPLIVTAVGEDGSPLLVGGLIICNYDDEGNERSLEPDDILRLTNAVQYSIQNGTVQPVLVCNI